MCNQARKIYSNKQTENNRNKILHNKPDGKFKSHGKNKNKNNVKSMRKNNGKTIGNGNDGANTGPKHGQKQNMGNCQKHMANN